ncbi:MAG: hypothetical protein Q9216_005565 [Gyalolechia sp. 2 TL-2023]
MEGDEDVEKGKRKRKARSKAVPGGKGLGGRWAYVSHKPVVLPERDAKGGFMGMFGLRPKGSREDARRCTHDARYVRFAFEPMILHVASASLAHAAPILSAAISAGFRESGVQSLKNLGDPNALPMVGIRSAGLAFESIIGVVRDAPNRQNPLEDGEDDNGVEEITEALVDEEYLEMLVKIANERFEANTQRIRRFEENLFGGKTKEEDKWEDKEGRKERKRREGLMKREALKVDGGAAKLNENQLEEGLEIGDLDGI